MKYFLLGAISVILLGMLISGAYLYGLKRGEKKFAPTPTPTISHETTQEPTLEIPTPSPTITLAPSPTFSPVASPTPLVQKKR